MVEVSWHRRGIEHQETVGVTEVGDVDHCRGHPGLAEPPESPDREVIHLRPETTRHIGRRGDLSPAQHGEVSGGFVERPGLAMGQTEHIDIGPGEDEGIQDRSQPG